jgi:hypothetical protein
MIPSGKYISRRMIIAILVSLLLLAVYTLIYRTYPFPGDWNDILLSVINFLASLLATLSAILVYKSFRAGDRPKKMWRYLMIGFGSWSISEIIWGIYYISGIEIPIPSFADLFWFLGYAFFTIALAMQFKVIKRSISRPAIILLIIGIYFLIAINVFGLIALIRAPINLPNLIEYSYPVMDFAVGIAALVLMFSFRGGKLAWSWIGMIIFSASDVLYAYLLASGLYAQSAESGNILSLVADTTYIAAYLVVMLGFFYYYLLIKNEQNTIPIEKRFSTP